jgi:adenosine deaminase
MSQTSLSFEMEEAVKAFNWDFAELQRITINAMKSAFIPYQERLQIIDTIIKPGYAKVSSAS